MNTFTRSIAMASARHPWRTFAAWIAVLVAVTLLAASGGGTFADDFSAKGSQSARAMALLDENFPDAAKGRALVVFEAQNGSLDDHRSDVAAVLSDVTGLDHVASGDRPVRGG